MTRILDTLLELRDATAAAITSTTSETGVGIDLTALWNYKVAVNVSSLDDADADETYVVTAEVDTTSGFASAVTVGSLTLTATGLYELPLSRDFVEHLEAGAAWIRVTATLGGTTPSLKYGAFLFPA